MRTISPGSTEGGPSCCKIAEMLAQMIQVEKGIDLAQKMVRWDVLLNAKLIKQCVLSWRQLAPSSENNPHRR